MNVIDYCFDGEIIINTRKDNKEEIKPPKIQEHLINHQKQQNENKLNKKYENQIELNLQNDIHNLQTDINEQDNNEIRKIPFRTLPLTLPNTPIFKSTIESNIIPQVSIFELLSKFDGETETVLNKEKNASTLMISKLPKYLMFTIQRFSKNNFFVEKNGTIINFVIKNLDMKEYIHPDYLSQNPVTKYNLIANVFHTGTFNQGIYKIHVYNHTNNEWYEIEDLHVISVLPQIVLLSESCIQLYQRQDIQMNGELKI